LGEQSGELDANAPQPKKGAGLRSEGNLKDLQLELVKLLLTSSMDFIRNTTQILQALTGLLLTSYVASFVGLAKQFSLSSLPLPLWVYSLPILLLVLSLGSSFVNAVFYSGQRVVFGDLNSALKGYDEAIRARRKHLVLPSVLTFLGIVALAVIAYCTVGF
jgi:hypothetical protein